MRSSAVSGIFTSGRRPQGFSSTLLKVPTKNEKTAKGIRKYVIKKEITHENYKDCLFNRKQILHKMNTIRSVNRQIGSYKLNKISLSCFDDKRYILHDGCKSLAYGHYKINQ